MKKLVTIKKRIKRALAAFLKDELLEFIGYGDKWMRAPSVIYNQTQFEIVTMERRIALNNHEVQYDIIKQVEIIKAEFAQELIKHIHIDTRELVDAEYPRATAIRLLLRVQTKQH